MEENKVTIEETASEEIKKPSKQKKPRKLKNQALFKNGSYSVAITALVVAGIIVLNILVGALSTRVTLDFDLTAEKVNSMTEENIEFLKSIKDDVNVTVCANETDYASYMSYYAQNYGVSDANTEYFTQTVNLINKYNKYNKKINVQFIDPQTTEFMAISTKYSTLNLSYGDIIVTATRGEDANERIKKLGFEDVYEISDASGYGYSYSIAANNIESSLTGAISFVLSGEEKKALVIKGHSASDNTSAYLQLLKANNYIVDTSTEQIIKDISKDYDAIVIISPYYDFMESELVAISEFLENDGKLGKGLVYFADASCPYLPNISTFLADWGINISEGVLFETDERYASPQDPTTLYGLPESDTGIDNISMCVTSYNVPILTKETDNSALEVTPIITTTETVVKAPVGVDSEWKDYTDDDKGQFTTAVKSVKFDYDDNNKRIESTVVAFASVQFVQSEWADSSRLSNKDVVLGGTDIAAGVTESGVSFISKTITNASFADSVTTAGVNAIYIIFMILLPIATIAIGVIVFIRRKNAE